MARLRQSALDAEVWWAIALNRVLLIMIEGIEMARSKMQKCLECGAYGLSTTCKECGGVAQAAGPLKFSPHDPQSERRRKYEKVTDPKWVEKLPSPKKEKDGSE